MYNFSYPLSLKDSSSPVSIFLFPRLTLQPALELTFEAQVGVLLHRVCRGVHEQLSERQGPSAVSYLSVFFYGHIHKNHEPLFGDDGRMESLFLPPLFHCPKIWVEAKATRVLPYTGNSQDSLLEEEPGCCY